MTQDSGGKSPSRKSDREERLAAALRENLRRRKTQVRGRGENQPSDAGSTEPKSDQGDK